MATPVPTNVKTLESLDLVVLQFSVVFNYPPQDPMATPQDTAFIATLATASGQRALYYSDGSVQGFVSANGRYTYTYLCRYATVPFVNIGLPGPQGPQGLKGDTGQAGSAGATGPSGFHPAAWDQVTWHIDPINGDDLNDGLVAERAIKTAAEYHRRVGTIHEFDRDITMWIHSSLPATDTLNLSGLRYTRPDIVNVAFRLVGVPKVVASGTISAVRTMDTSVNRPWGISSVSIGSFTPYIRPGTVIIKTSGSDAGVTTMIPLKNEGEITRISHPAYDVSGDFSGMQIGTIAGGDTFDIVDLPEIPSIIFGPTVPLIGSISVSRLFLSSYATITGIVFFRTCAFNMVISEHGQQVFNSCQVGSVLVAKPGANPYFQYGALLGTSFVNEGRVNLEYYVILQGCMTYAVLYGESGNSSGITCHGSTFGVFDAPGSGLIVGGNQVCDIRSYVWGSGNVGHPVEIQNGGRLVYRQANPFVLTGGLSDILLGGRLTGPAVTGTNPYAYTEDRDYSFTNLNATMTAGGFGGNIFDPANPATCIVSSALPAAPLGVSGALGFHPVAWDQTSWHIDPIAGVDTNDGLTAGTAIKTAGEYHRRVGDKHEFDRTITMTIHSSLPQSDCLDLSGLRVVGEDSVAHYPPILFTVTGITTTVVSGIAVSRTFSQATNIPHGLSCVALGSLASYVKMGRMVKKTSGTNITDSDTELATAAWLVKDENGAIARMSYPGYLDDVNFSYAQCNEGVINTGDTFSIVDLPEVPNFLPPSVNQQNWNVRFRRLRFGSGFGYPYVTSGLFIQCAFDACFNTGRTTMTNCQFGWLFGQQSGSSSYLTLGSMLGSTIINDGRITIQNYMLLQGVTNYAPNSADEGQSAGVSCHTRGFGVYDSPGAGLIVPSGQVWYINGAIYGSGSVGHPLEIWNGGKFITLASGGVHCLTGGVGLSDIMLAGRTSGPAVNTTNPYGYTGDRAYSFANLYQTVAAGGFGGSIFDPANPSTAILKGSSA